MKKMKETVSFIALLLAMLLMISGCSGNQKSGDTEATFKTHAACVYEKDIFKPNDREKLQERHKLYVPVGRKNRASGDYCCSYTRGYRDIYDDVRLLHKILIKFCDNAVRMKFVKVFFAHKLPKF